MNGSITLLRGGNKMKRICVVTGGAKGIGRCIAEEFIHQGDFVAIIDTDEAAGRRLSARYGYEHLLFFPGDIGEEKVLDDFVAAVVEKHCGIDALVNNACQSRGGLEGCNYDDFNYVLRVGVTAPFYLTQQLLPYFRPGASVVNIASTRAFMSQANTESYTAAKGGISALTHAMSVTLAVKARVNSISPGWIDTGDYQNEEDYVPAFSSADCVQHPAGRVGAPKDIAAMVLFLCSDKAGFITGQDIIIDGGMTKQMIYHGDFGWVFEPEK